jgi:copper(I)-binding protein
MAISEDVSEEDVEAPLVSVSPEPTNIIVIHNFGHRDDVMMMENQALH